ncbi:hypothetical protein EJ110_NYTH34300 [Nymphaea thermarum]|nr:hypothetical protein EJ110_NYTH34300 [Nymphaea thermarum]
MSYSRPYASEACEDEAIIQTPLPSSSCKSGDGTELERLAKHFIGLLRDDQTLNPVHLLLFQRRHINLCCRSIPIYNGSPRFRLTRTGERWQSFSLANLIPSVTHEHGLSFPFTFPHTWMPQLGLRPSETSGRPYHNAETPGSPRRERVRSSIEPKGDTAYCSLECRQQQMNIDEKKEKCSMTSMKKEAAPAGSESSGKGETTGFCKLERV